MSRRLDWSRPLPRTLDIPKVMKLRTLADVRELMHHLPADHRQRSTWRYVASQLADAAGEGDVIGVYIALRLG